MLIKKITKENTPATKKKHPFLDLEITLELRPFCADRVPVHPVPDLPHALCTGEDPPLLYPLVSLTIPKMATLTLHSKNYDSKELAAMWPSGTVSDRTH